MQLQGLPPFPKCSTARCYHSARSLPNRFEKNEIREHRTTRTKADRFPSKSMKSRVGTGVSREKVNGLGLEPQSDALPVELLPPQTALQTIIITTAGGLRASTQQRIMPAGIFDLDHPFQFGIMPHQRLRRPHPFSAEQML